MPSARGTRGIAGATPGFQEWVRVFGYALHCPEEHCRPETTLSELLEKAGREGQLARKVASGPLGPEWVVRLRLAFGEIAEKLFAFLRLSLRHYGRELDLGMTLGDLVVLSSEWQLWPAFADDAMQLDVPSLWPYWRRGIGNLFTLAGRKQLEWSELHALFSEAGDVGAHNVRQALEALGELFGVCPRALRPQDRIVHDDTCMDAYMQVIMRAGQIHDRRHMLSPETRTAVRETERHYAGDTLGYIVASLGLPDVVTRPPEPPEAEGN